MSQSQAAYRFLSWARRGAATRIVARDVPTETGSRVQIPIGVTFNHDAEQTASLSLTLSGPGDVVNFDRRAIVRVWPPPYTTNAEANYFPALELDQVDLPWRYSPRTADDDGRVRPWLCLIALRDDEIVEVTPARGDRALAAVEIALTAPLPRIDQAWAWAHVQISGDDDTPLAELVAHQPARCLARLLCPRRLDARTAYNMMLVPIFEVGRRAGLREPLGDQASVLNPAWPPPPEVAQLVLPIYHQWRFTTGAGGDFESLVEQLKPRPLPTTVGTRALDVTAPGGGLPAAAATPLLIGGALRGTDTPEPAPPDAAFVTALTALLNLPAHVKEAGGQPVVAPPLYGTWHARRVRLEPGGQPPWFRQLNEDPRTRIAAALGTEVVQTKQQELMASAWHQVAGIREANDQLCHAQLARAISERLHARFVADEPESAVVGFAATVLGHIRHQQRTVRSLAQTSPPRLALLSSAFRRAARPLGPVGRRQGRPDAAPTALVEMVNAGGYQAVIDPIPQLPASVPSSAWLTDLYRGWPPDSAEIQAAPPCDKDIAWDPVFGAAPNGPLGDRADSPSMAAFRAAADALAKRDVTPRLSDPLRQLDLPALRAAVVAALDPRTTIPAGFGPRLVLAQGFGWNPPDPIEPVMAHPVFPQAMYKALAELSPDWILPGLGDVPPDTATLAKTNPAFIEGYLVGLNHEMARELLWSEYPSDQRGSYFRQFWDPSGPMPSPPFTRDDIMPLHAWTSTLGDHSGRPTPPGQHGQHLVLLVRGEVLRRYPSTIVYALRADRSSGSPVLGSDRLEPVFAGRLPPDVAFFGFAIEEAVVRGADTEANPGWFFVFEEQPGEPRFGLEVVASAKPLASWDELAWPDLALDASTLHYIDLAEEVPAARALQTVGGAAWHAGPGPLIARGADHAAITSQRPVRVAVHASQMLPP